LSGDDASARRWSRMRLNIYMSLVPNIVFINSSTVKRGRCWNRSRRFSSGLSCTAFLRRFCGRRKQRRVRAPRYWAMEHAVFHRSIRLGCVGANSPWRGLLMHVRVRRTVALPWFLCGGLHIQCVTQRTADKALIKALLETEEWESLEWTTDDTLLALILYFATRAAGRRRKREAEAIAKSNKPLHFQLNKRYGKDP
jgi:hypothetical protein